MGTIKECKYCGELKVLVKSHVIPRSFYEIKSFKQKAPKKSLSILSDSEDLKPIRRPVGIYDEELFCKDCEEKFMIYDDYAFKLLNEQTGNRKSFRDLNGEVLTVYYENYEYRKLKLFFMSVLLRAGLSDDFFFQLVELGPYIEILKDAIGTEKAPDIDDFAVFLTYYDEIKRGPVIFPPATIRIDKVKFYHFHLGRVIFYIKVDKRNVPEELQPVILKPNSRLFLLRFSIRDSNAYDILTRTVKNPANKEFFLTSPASDS